MENKTASKDNSIFVRELSAAQDELRLFITLLMDGDEENAKDVLQETNARIWQEQAAFDPAIASFRTWSRAIARFEVLRARKTLARNRARFVSSDEVFSQIETFAERELVDIPERIAALHACFAKLPRRDRALINRHYIDGKTFAALANETHSSEVALKMRFSRLRKKLASCVRNRCELATKGVELADDTLVNINPFFDTLDDLFIHSLLLLDAHEKNTRKAKRNAFALRFLRRIATPAACILVFGALASSIILLGTSHSGQAGADAKTLLNPGETQGQSSMKTQLAIAAAGVSSALAAATSASYISASSDSSFIDTRNADEVAVSAPFIETRLGMTSISSCGTIDTAKSIGTVVILN